MYPLLSNYRFYTDNCTLDIEKIDFNCKPSEERLENINKYFLKFIKANVIHVHEDTQINLSYESTGSEKSYLTVDNGVCCILSDEFL